MNRGFMYPYYEEWGDAKYLSGNLDFNPEKFRKSESGMHLMNARSLMTRFSG